MHLKSIEQYCILFNGVCMYLFPNSFRGRFWGRCWAGRFQGGSGASSDQGGSGAGKVLGQGSPGRVLDGPVPEGIENDLVA